MTCRHCKGTGRIELLTSTVDCECVDFFVGDLVVEITAGADYLDEIAEDISQLHTWPYHLTDDDT